jgi:ABC-type sugar transport system ATPase subunit
MGTTMIYVTHDQVEAMTLGDRVAVIHQGRLQQVAPPQELYARPSNVFVAGFIGNPPMNLFPTCLSLEAGGQLLLQLGDQSIPILGSQVSTAPLQAYQNKRLTGGIRPEAIRLAASGSQASSIQAIVEAVEPLGHETLLYVRVGQECPLVARLPGMQAFSKDERLYLEIEHSSIYLFDPEGRILAD